MPENPQNTLYYGDNLKILEEYIDDETIDLIYLDPPFKSNQDYNVLFAEKNGSGSQSQIKVFEDTWEWGPESEEAYEGTILEGGLTGQTIKAFREFLGENDMMAYLSMMAPRLKELHRVLSPTGSIYLHCDPTASHYLKILMDSIFKPNNFRNEIIWHYSGWNKRLTSHIERRHDVILFYSKSDTPFFNYPTRPYENIEEYIKKRKQEVHEEPDGRPYVLSDGGGGKFVKRYIDEAMAYGVPLDDVWDIDKLNNSSKERLGYPTQKPEILLQRIIEISSKEGDIILDPFCGCGTSISVAEKLGRKWIGIDVTHLAISLIKNRLNTQFHEQVSYKIIGEPEDMSGAIELALEDRYQFQWWALSRVNARPVPTERKKGSDKGIDGRIYFFEHKGMKKPQQIIFSVKSGGVGSHDIRDLRGVIERENASIGVLITLEKPTAPMIKEAAKAGFYQFSGIKSENYPKIQILTIEDLFEEKSIKCPPYVYAGGNVTHKQAQKFVLPKGRKAKQMKLQ
jgi:site-specific DNA-methyltransferase (adenine-specific)